MNFIIASVLLFLLTSTKVYSQIALTRCILLYPKSSCFALYYPLKDGVLSNNRTMFELLQAFYPVGAFASTALINILYTVKFTETALSGPLCDGLDDNSTILTSEEEMQFLSGWSSSSVFNIISPLQLSKLQLQLFNDMFSFYIIPGSGIALTRQFLWDSDEIFIDKTPPLPLEMSNLVQINITLDEISCVPDTDLVKAVLQDTTIMLKIWTATTNQDINVDDLGFATEPGIELSGVSKLLFTQYFITLITTVCALLGISVLIVSGALFTHLFNYMSEERKQFKYYFFSLSLTCFMLDIVIIILDFNMAPQWCNTEFFSYITRRPETACDGVIITKIIYFCCAIPLSLLTAALSSKSYEVLALQNKHFKRFEKLIYVVCLWNIVLLTMLIAWAVLPTLLLLFVYPNIVLPLTLLMIASVFWTSVILSIPPLLVHNLHQKTHCLAILFYLSPLGGLVIMILAMGIITVTYLNASVFGSGIGGAVGIFAAVVPSVGLTLFSEFYREWFLTRVLETTKVTAQENVNKKETPDDDNQSPGAVPLKEISKNTNQDNESSDSEQNTTEAVVEIPIKFNSGEDLVEQNELKELEDREVRTKLKRTNEPLGFLEKRFKNLSTGQKKSDTIK